MIINLYAIRDVLNGFAPPIMMPNHESAIRWFKDMCEENPSMKNNKEDFTVHFVGQLNTETGEIRSAEDKYLRKDLANYKEENT